MKTATLLLAAALAFAAAPDDLEERFYRAYYAENGLRDFPGAAEAYADVHIAARAANRNDLAVKALLGRARCMRTMGKGDEARAALAGVLQIDPGNEEARAGAAAAVEDDGGDADLEERIRFLVFEGLLGNGVDCGSAARELRLLGNRCLPRLAEALGARELATVEVAAKYLASLDSAEAGAILVRAMRDPKVVFRTAVARTACFPTEDGSQATSGKKFSVKEVPVLAEAAGFPEADIRHGAVDRLFTEGDPLDDAGRSLLVRLATDPDRSVRMRILVCDLTQETTRVLAPALRRSMASESREERLLAVQKVQGYPSVAEALADALRGLLHDPDAEVRAHAFASLRSRLTEGDLAGMLDPADAPLAAGAAEALRGFAPWSPGTAAAVQAALGRAIRGEFPADHASYILDLAFAGGQSGTESTRLVDVYASTSAPDAKAGERVLGPFRAKLLQRIQQPLRFDQSPWKEQAIALVEEGVERCYASGWALYGWVTHWNSANVSAPRAWMRAAASDDPRVRRVAYAGLVRSSRQEGFAISSDRLPHLPQDLVSSDREMQSLSFQVAERAPSAAIAEGIRALHAAADRPQAREKLLGLLVAAAGRGAEDAVRADLASEDATIRFTALRCLVIDLRSGTREDLDAFVAKGGDPGAVMDLPRYGVLPDRMLLFRFAMELHPEKYSGYFVSKAAPFVDGNERVELLSRALASREPEVLRAAADAIGDLRILHLWPQLLTLLESGNSGVREAAEKSLAALRTYAELKASLARFGKDEQQAAIRNAEGLLSSDDPLKRKGAVLALAALGDRASIPTLLRALEDPDRGVRDAALAALERLGGTTAPR